MISCIAWRDEMHNLKRRTIPFASIVGQEDMKFALILKAVNLLAALLAKTHQDLATFSSLILLPMTFLGGTFFSVNQVPLGLKMALYALPLTHSSICLRAAALGQPIPWESFLAIAAFLLIFFLGGMAVISKISV
jgi:ABC-type polysaccharide/polyol phosphate export permease